jgi:hypothetical protein
MLPYERVPVHKPFASHTLHRKSRALYVIDAELGAGVLAEIEFSKVAVQVLLIDQAALQHGKKAFQGVRGSYAANPFKLGMVHRLMVRNRPTEGP